MTVIERDYSVAPSQRSPKAGMTTFIVLNRVTVKIQSGTYTLFCPLHYALGMKTTIKVAGSASSGGHRVPFRVDAPA